MKKQPALVSLLTILLTTFLTVSCRAAAADDVTFEIIVEGEGNEVIAETGDGGVVFDIFSERGIGAASVALVTGEFPSSVVLKLHLRGLEELRFSYGETEVLVSVSSSQGNVVRERVNHGSEGAAEEDPISPLSPYWMTVEILQEDGSPGTIPLDGGVIVVTVAEDFLQGDYDAFQVRWIDFYR